MFKEEEFVLEKSAGTTWGVLVCSAVCPDCFFFFLLLQELQMGLERTDLSEGSRPRFHQLMKTDGFLYQNYPNIHRKIQ